MITIMVLIVAVISDRTIASTTTGSESEFINSSGVIFRKSEAMGNIRISRNNEIRMKRARLNPSPFVFSLNDASLLLVFRDRIKSIVFKYCTALVAAYKFYEIKRCVFVFCSGNYAERVGCDYIKFDRNIDLYQLVPVFLQNILSVPWWCLSSRPRPLPEPSSCS